MTDAGRQSAFRGVALLTAATPVSFGLGLIASAVIARALGPELFGRYAYLVWLSGLLVLLANNALPTTGIRFVSESIGRQSRDLAGIVHRWLGVRQAICAAVVAALAVGSVPFIDGHASPDQAWTVAALVAIGVAAKSRYLFDVSIAKGYGRYAVEAVSALAVGAVNLGCVLLLAAAGASLVHFVAAFSAAGIGYAIVAAGLNRRAGLVPVHGRLDAALQDRVNRHLAWTVLLTTTGLVSSRSIETFLLNAVAGPAEVGFFAIAAALTRGGTGLLTSGLSAVLMPSMAHAFGAQGPRRVATLLSDAVRYFQFAGLLLAGVGVLWSEPVVRLLYGPAFLPVVDVVRIMLLVAGAALAGDAFGAVLTTTDHQRARAVIAVASVVLSAAAAFALVPRFGLIGAVAAHALSTLAIHALTVGLVNRIMETRLPLRELALQFGSAVVAGTVAWTVVAVTPGITGQWLAGIAYALVLPAASIIARAWTGADADRVMRLTSVGLTRSAGLRRLIDRCAMRAAGRP